MLTAKALPATLAELFSAKKGQFARIGDEDRQKVQSALRGKPKITFGDVEAGISEAYLRALDVRLVDCFLGGWAKLSEVSSFANTSKHPPGEHNFVPLARHTVTSRHKPKIEVLVDKVPVFELPLDVAVSAAFDAAVLEIEGGKVRAVRSGSCKITGAVSCRGVNLASVRALDFAFPGHTKINPGFSLAEGAVDVPAPRAAAAGATQYNGAADAKYALLLSGHDDGGRALKLVIPAAGNSDRTLTLGRSAEQADLVIPHKTVSSRHARVRVTGKGVEVCDLGSSNGTRVDGKKIGEEYVPINQASRIAFGSCELTLTHA